MEAIMAFGADNVVAELAALRMAVKKLIEVANLDSAEPGKFGKNALKEGLAELIDNGQWDIPEERKPKFQEDAKERYRSLFGENK
jgi:acyl-CoA-binding protein